MRVFIGIFLICLTIMITLFVWRAAQWYYNPLVDNPKSVQELYMQALSEERFALAMDVLAAEGITIDFDNAFYKVHRSARTSRPNIETVTALTSNNHILGFGVQRDRLISAFLAGQVGDDVYTIDLNNRRIARAEITGHRSRLRGFSEGSWQDDTSFASMSTIGQTSTEILFYGVTFPSRYARILFQFQPRQAPHSLNINISNHDDSICSIDELNRRVQTQQSFFQGAMEMSISLSQEDNERISRGVLGRFQRALNACSEDSQSSVCNFWLRRAQDIWKYYNGGLEEQKYAIRRNAISHFGNILQSTELQTQDFLSESGCIPLIVDEIALELSANHGETVTAHADTFMFNDVNATAPYLVMTVGSFFEVTSYIANGETVDDLPVMLPANSHGGVEIAARCPQQDSDISEPTYEGVILATPPFGEAAFLGVSLECL